LAFLASFEMFAVPKIAVTDNETANRLRKRHAASLQFGVEMRELIRHLGAPHGLDPFLGKLDPVAMRLLVERILPAKKYVPLKVELPEKFDTASEISAALSTVIAQVATGEIAPEEALQVGALLEEKRKCIETSELEARMAAIERKMVEEHK